jgi:glucuronoarabinoxylan endo-1,4-beta-xylanase
MKQLWGNFGVFQSWRWLLVLSVTFLASTVLSDANVALNPGFEDGTSEWLARAGSISAVTSPVRSGHYSGRSYNRTATWQGIQQNMLDKMVPGQTYQISGWVRMENAASATLKITMEKTDNNGTTSYTNIAGGTANDTGWIQLSGNYKLNVTGTLTGLYLYFECTSNATASFFVDDVVVYGPEPGPVVTTSQVNPGIRHQTLEGFGGAGGWYEGSLTGHSQRETIYNLLFGDLGLDIYRVRNTYSYDSSYMSHTGTIVAEGLERNPGLKILISCWSPPAWLKSNGKTGGGGTLIGGPGSYNYQGLADWWADSITGWAGYGVYADYISIQNEPDFTADWDSCRYEPRQTGSYAGYAEAFEAVYSEMNSRYGSSMPKMLGPETTGFHGAAGSNLDAYLSALINTDHVYGYAHHLYNINAGDNPDAYLSTMQSYNAAWGSKPLFQTEYEKRTGAWPDALNMAHLLHNSLTVEEVSSYFYWDLFWGGNGGLIALPSSSVYTINNNYWGFKHFAAFTDPGWQRIGAASASAQLRTSAFINPNNDQLAIMLINPGYSDIQTTISFTNSTGVRGQIYRTTETENCVLAGNFDPSIPLDVPARSVITLSLTADTGTTPPNTPTGLAAMPGNQTVALDWDDNTDMDLAGYNIYRSETSGSGYVKLNASLQTLSSYTDFSAENFTPYYYVVTAVDTNTNESGYSNEVQAMPNDGSLVQLCSADFETGFGDWINISGEDSHDWTRHTGGTPSPGTGPLSGAEGSSWYIYLETSAASGIGNMAILESPVLHGFARKLTFDYHMYGSTIGTLHVDVFDGTWHQSVWSLNGQQQADSSEAYRRASVDLKDYLGLIKVRLRAVAAGGFRGDAAIDNLTVTGATVYGDVYADNIVDLHDFLLFVENWLIEDCTLDRNGDCFVDLIEFSELAKNWLDDSFR